MKRLALGLLLLAASTVGQSQSVDTAPGLAAFVNRAVVVIPPPGSNVMTDQNGHPLLDQNGHNLLSN